jgi:hypothetical protein
MLEALPGLSPPLRSGIRQYRIVMAKVSQAAGKGPARLRDTPTEPEHAIVPGQLTDELRKQC